MRTLRGRTATGSVRIGLFAVISLTLSGIAPGAHAATAPAPESDPTHPTSRSAAPSRHLPPRWRPFAPDSVWNTPVPNDAKVDPKSRAMVALLADPAATRVSSFGEFGVSVYDADTSTPRHHVVVTREPAWGTNRLSKARVPIPDGATPAPGTDGKLVIIDWNKRKVYDLWQARHEDGMWYASWGGVYDLSGSGSSTRPGYVGEYAVTWPSPVSRGTGAGFSSLAGLVRVEEVRQGVINHALVFGTNRACGPPDEGPFRSPATTTDGLIVGEDCIPQGTWVQLDPSIDVDGLPGLSPFDKMLARALQRFGAYCNDNSGTRMAFGMEWPKDGWGQVYVDAGLPSNYFDMTKIPWNKLRVLEEPGAATQAG